MPGVLLLTKYFFCINLYQIPKKGRAMEMPTEKQNGKILIILTVISLVIVMLLSGYCVQSCVFDLSKSGKFSAGLTPIP